MELFGTDGVTVTLEWTQNNSYNISVDPYLPVNSFGNKSIQLSVSYNTMYNVSVTSLGVCGQNDVLELYYGEPVIMKILQ